MRQIHLTTDDQEEAYVALLRLRASRDDQGWDMAEVRRMDRPVHTKHKWVVYRELTEAPVRADDDWGGANEYEDDEHCQDACGNDEPHPAGYATHTIPVVPPVHERIVVLPVSTLMSAIAATATTITGRGSMSGITDDPMTIETARMFYDRALKAEAEVERLRTYIDNVPYGSDFEGLEDALERIAAGCDFPPGKPGRPPLGRMEMARIAAKALEELRAMSSTQQHARQ
jgi:hypothetical protein